MIFTQSKSGYTFLNELEINGENVDDEQNDYTQETDDDPDYTEETDDDMDYTDEEMPEDDESSDGEAPADDNEISTEEPADDTDTPAEDTDSAEDADNTDYTAEEMPEDDESGDVSADDISDNGEDDDTDYTQMDDSDEGDNDESSNDNVSDDDGSIDDTSGGDQSLADMEKNLFSDLTPQQLAIKNAELLQNFIDLYNALDETFDNINKIPKTYQNSRIIEFVADKLVDLKDRVNYIITTTYVTKTYVENVIVYKQCLLIYHQIGTMLKGLIQKQPK